MLMAYESDPSHVIDYSDLVVEDDASYAVTPAEIIDRQEKVLRGEDDTAHESALEAWRH